ncbi:MAG: hemerythrin domain-containing protein [Immundisolibacteraceae bacterium]|nr:hemerythrin domain-containing protein [Immundisolibacteraceae bacterium]
MEFKYKEPATEFSDGLAVIRAYHDNLLATGERLLKLSFKISHHGVGEAAAIEAIDLHQHYTRANTLHHADEEQCLFPLLVGQDLILDGMIERLTLDHEEIEQWWAELAGFLATPEKISDMDRLVEVAFQFERLQREHLTRENEDFLPRVEEQLNIFHLQQAGQGMARLRGLSAAA